MVNYYSLTLGVGGFIGNIYVNLFISACVESTAYIIDVFVIKK